MASRMLSRIFLKKTVVTSVDKLVLLTQFHAMHCLSPVIDHSLGLSTVVAIAIILVLLG